MLELTDAGPGVGCNNNAVQYRMAESILINNFDKVIRVHRARGDSGQNENPWSCYYGKLERFCQLHFKRGELYIEYLRGSYEETSELCKFCAVWSGPKTDHVPRPYPDYTLPGRETPVRDKEGNARAIDDFQP